MSTVPGVKCTEGEEVQVTTYQQIWMGESLIDVKLTADVEFDKSYPISLDVRNIRASWEGVDYTNYCYKPENYSDVEYALKEE